MYIIAEAGKTELDQLTGSLATDLSSECSVLVDAARDTIDGHKGTQNSIRNYTPF